jgi:hypothetical protein
MVTRPQIEKLSARIEALAAIADGGGRPVCVWHHKEETEQQALERHYQARPEDRKAAQIYILRWAEACGEWL